MADKWRLVGPHAFDAYMNMAIDEAMLEARAEGSVPNTLRLYMWKPSAVSIGYFQGLRDEVDLGTCKRFGLDVVRRITGGGAVLHDSEGELTYSLVLGQDGGLGDILKSYKILGGGLIYALKNLGLESDFQGINDIVVAGRKISGNAQTRRRGVILQHGTLLIRADRELISKVLKPSAEKLKPKGLTSTGARITSLASEIGDVPFGRVVKAVEEGFHQALGSDLEPGELTDGEVRVAQRLRVEKYMDARWNGRR